MKAATAVNRDPVKAVALEGVVVGGSVGAAELPPVGAADELAGAADELAGAAEELAGAADELAGSSLIL